MKRLKFLAPTIVVAFAIFAIAGISSAGATVFCKTNTTPCGSKYPAGSNIAFKLNTGTKAVLKAGFAVIECTEGEIATEITNAGGAGSTLDGNIIVFKLATCNCTVTVIAPGGAEAHIVSGGMAAIITLSGWQIEVKCGEIAACKFGGSISSGSVMTGGNPAIYEFSEAPFPKVSGPVTCNNPSKFTAKLTASGTNTAIWAAES